MIFHYYFNDGFHILLMLNTTFFIRRVYKINTAFLLLIRDFSACLLKLRDRKDISFTQIHLHALSSSSSSSFCLHVSLTGVLSEAPHISRHAHGSKWDATLLSRKRSRLLSLTLRCPAVSSPQIIEDDNYVPAEEPIFACAATSVHDTHSQVGRTDTSKAPHSNTWPY